ncbi:MAG: hypothetical protein M5R42_17845 [Rhodocyclaceae bacterium]|nr:hypothetical protein [Rhodocyclaceae bacterium]
MPAPAFGWGTSRGSPDMRPSSPRSGPIRSGFASRVFAGTLLALCLAWPARDARAQADGDEGVLEIPGAIEGRGEKLTNEEATRLLALPLPDAPDARYALLQRQYNAALLLEDRARLVEVARQLVDAGRGRPGGEAWITIYLNAEFSWGSSGKAFEASDPLSPTRACRSVRARRWRCARRISPRRATIAPSSSDSGRTPTI